MNKRINKNPIPIKEDLLETFLFTLLNRRFGGFSPPSSGFKRPIKEALFFLASLSVLDGVEVIFFVFLSSIEYRYWWWQYIHWHFEPWRRWEDPPRRRFKTLKRNVSNKSSFIVKHIFIFPWTTFHSILRFKCFFDSLFYSSPKNLSNQND